MYHLSLTGVIAAAPLVLPPSTRGFQPPFQARPSPNLPAFLAFRQAREKMTYGFLSNFFLSFRLGIRKVAFSSAPMRLAVARRISQLVCPRDSGPLRPGRSRSVGALGSSWGKALKYSGPSSYLGRITSIGHSESFNV